MTPVRRMDMQNVSKGPCVEIMCGIKSSSSRGWWDFSDLKCIYWKWWKWKFDILWRLLDQWIFVSKKSGLGILVLTLWFWRFKVVDFQDACPTDGYVEYDKRSMSRDYFWNQVIIIPRVVGLLRSQMYLLEMMKMKVWHFMTPPRPVDFLSPKKVS